MSTKYYRIISTLKQQTGFNYATVAKDKNGKDKNTSHRVSVPGKYRPNDPPAVTYITEAEFKGIIQQGDNGKPSPFNVILDETKAGAVHGFTVGDCLFSEMPEEFQKKFNPKYFAQLEAGRKKEKAKADKEAEADKE